MIAIVYIFAALKGLVAGLASMGGALYATNLFQTTPMPLESQKRWVWWGAIGGALGGVVGALLA